MLSKTLSMCFLLYMETEHVLNIEDRFFIFLFFIRTVKGTGERERRKENKGEYSVGEYTGQSTAHHCIAKLTRLNRYKKSRQFSVCWA